MAGLVRAETQKPPEFPAVPRKKNLERAPLKPAGFCVQNAKIALKGARWPRGLLRKNRGFAYAKPRRFLR